MKTYIVTNRYYSNSLDETGKYPPSDSLRFGEYDDTQPKAKRLNIYQDIFTPDIQYSPSAITRGTTKSNKDVPQGSPLFFRNLFEEMSDGVRDSKGTGNDTLVFIHGFNVSFDEAISTAKSLAKAYITPNSPIKRIVIFTWPSNGKTLDYREDRRDAEISGYALGRAIFKFTDFMSEFFKGSRDNPEQEQPCSNNVHLMCHSMGGYVLESALQMMSQQSAPMRTVFKEILLMAPDVDWNALEKPKALYNITSICERVHIYYNKYDMALSISETTKNAANRLGKYGPQQSSNIPENISIIDVSDIHLRGLVDRIKSHSYFTLPRIVSDVQGVLNGEHSAQIPGREYVEYRNRFRLQ
jgi:esterase/lipase superfamily enzyme